MAGYKAIRNVVEIWFVSSASYKFVENVCSQTYMVQTIQSTKVHFGTDMLLQIKIFYCTIGAQLRCTFHKLKHNFLAFLFNPDENIHSAFAKLAFSIVRLFYTPSYIHSWMRVWWLRMCTFHATLGGERYNSHLF